MEMPIRTMSRAASGLRWMAAELQQCSRMPPGSGFVSCRKRSYCASVKAMSLPSASAKWVNAPVMRTSGHWSKVSSMARTSSSVRTPIRLMPVSIFRCTRPVLPWLFAACCTKRTISGVHTARVRSWATPSMASTREVAPSISTGAAIPACRSCTPSSTVAVAS